MGSDLDDLIDSLREAYAEILGFYVIFELINFLQNWAELSNLLNSGEITPFVYVIRLSIIPAIPSIIVGYIVHWIREQLDI